MQLSLSVFLFLNILHAAQAASFADPVGYGVKWRYWIENARADPTVVSSDIADMAATGASGVELLVYQNYGQIVVEDPSGFTYGSSNFRSLFDKISNNAVSNNLTLDLCGGPAQGAGIPAANPDQAGFNTELAFGFTFVSASTPFDGEVPKANIFPLLSFGSANNNFNVTTARLEGVVFAVLGPNANTSALDIPIVFSTAKDVTANVTNGRLRISPPVSNSVIIAFYSRRNGYQEAFGAFNGGNPSDPGTLPTYTVDHFSADGARKIDQFNEQHLFSPTSSAFRKAGRLIWQDSHEFRAQLHWTASFSAKFEAMHGYKPALGMPAFYSRSEAGVGAENLPPQLFSYTDPSVNAKFSRDYQETLSALYMEYIGERNAGIKKLGFSYSMQPGYNLPVDCAAAAGLVDVPEIESLTLPTVDMGRQVAGGVHLGVKKLFSSELGAVQVKSYSQLMSEIIQLAYVQFAAGVNLLVLHGFPYTGQLALTTWPGFTPFGFVYSELHGPRQPAFAQYRPYITMLARTQMVLQKGNTGKVDLAILRTQTNVNATLSFQSNTLAAAGFTYDYVSPFNFELPAASVSGGRLAASGPGYKALILNFQSALGLSAAQKILQFGKAGLPMVIIGGPPSEIPGYEHGTAKRDAVREAMRALVKLPNVKVVSNYATANAALKSLKVEPATAFGSAAPEVYSVRRTMQCAATTTDYYWLYNSGSQPVEIDISFETAESAFPFIMDVWSGSVTPVAAFKQLDQRSVRLSNVSLNAGSTTIFAFTNGGSPEVVGTTCKAITSVEGTTAIRITSIDGAAAIRISPTALELRATQEGSISVQVSGEGTKRNFQAKFPQNTGSIMTLTNWTLTLTTWSAPEDLSDYRSKIVTESPVMLNNLFQWSSIAQFVKSTSGVGKYATTFVWPAGPVDVGATLDLTGSTNGFLHTAVVNLNGVTLPPVDPTTLKLDLPQAALKQGTNNLTIEVASTLINAINQVDPKKITTFGGTRDVVLPAFLFPDQVTGIKGTVKIVPYIRKTISSM
ncbi:hypothetical protein BJ742DRAFT_882315 [Cladochytrium replicatum]|nr:hypothetical protein BJ742DRAFT_882315 [Cladochytrium replicatum]